MILTFQVGDPGSSPGGRTFYNFYVKFKSQSDKWPTNSPRTVFKDWGGKSSKSFCRQNRKIQALVRR